MSDSPIPFSLENNLIHFTSSFLRSTNTSTSWLHSETPRASHLSGSTPTVEWGLAQPLLLQTTGTAHLTGVGPAAQRSQAKQVLSWMQCVCLVSKETHIAENVQCFTKSTKQRSLQGPSSLLLQSNRKKLKWQRRCASTSLCH